MPLGCVFLEELIYVVILYKPKSIGVYVGASLHSCDSPVIVITFSPPICIMCLTRNLVSLEQ